MNLAFFSYSSKWKCSICIVNYKHILYNFMEVQYSKKKMRLYLKTQCLHCKLTTSSRWGSPHGHWNRIHWIKIPDTDSMWSPLGHVRAPQTTHNCCWTGSHALLRAVAARSSDLDRGRLEVKWSLDPVPRSAPGPDPKSRVESPNIPHWQCWSIGKTISALAPDISVSAMFTFCR